MRTALITTALILTVAGPASAQGLIRQQIDNTLNNVQTMLGDDSPDHEIRRLSDRLRLLDTEQERMLGVLESKRQERENIAAALAERGIETPPPVLQTPVMVPDSSSGETRHCLMSFSGTPIVCW